MTDYALVTKNSFRATLRTEEGSLLEVTGDPISGGGASGASTSFVFRPGGVAADGVFVTAPALKAGLLTVDPAADKTIVVDASIAAAHLTAADSPWPLDNATFESANGADLLTLDAGCTFTAGTRTLRLRNIAVAIDAGSGAPIWTPTPGAFLEMQDAVINNPSAVAFAHVNGPGGAFAVILRTASIQAGILAEIMPTGVAECVALGGSIVPATSFHSVLGAGGNLILELDGASQALVSQVQDQPNLTVAVTTLDPLGTFIFQPGGVAGGNVFTSDAALRDAIKLTPGPRTVYIDGSLAVPHFTGAGWDLDNVTLRVLESGANFTLVIDEGMSFASSFLEVNGLSIDNETTSAPPWTPAGFTSLRLVNGATLFSGVGKKPFMAVTAPASASQFVLEQAISVGNGTDNVITVAAGQSLDVFADGPQFETSGGILAHVFGGLGSVAVLASEDSQVSTTQNVSTFTLRFPSHPNLVQGAGNTGTGTGTVSFTTGNIAKEKSGKMACSGVVTGQLSGAGNITVSLLRDATPIGAALPAFAALATQAFAIPYQFIDTAPDAANHTYKLQAVASAGNITTGASGIQLQVIEQ